MEVILSAVFLFVQSRTDLHLLQIDVERQNAPLESKKHLM